MFDNSQEIHIEERVLPDRIEFRSVLADGNVYGCALAIEVPLERARATALVRMKARQRLILERQACNVF